MPLTHGLITKELSAPYRTYARNYFGFLFLAMIFAHGTALARDSGQWGSSDTTIKEWYQSLMRPDAPEASCCSFADAYWADKITIRNGKTFVTITDDRPDGPLGRPHVPDGTEFEVPNEKLKFDRGNPTGHGIIFLSRVGYVFCYVQGYGT